MNTAVTAVLIAVSLAGITAPAPAPAGWLHGRMRSTRRTAVMPPQEQNPGYGSQYPAIAEIWHPAVQTAYRII
jgi:hypothetical protein